ncbi:hypothetical protein AHAS_Ahas05G0056900 [Arachis hypogaea]
MLHRRRYQPCTAVSRNLHCTLLPSALLASLPSVAPLPGSSSSHPFGRPCSHRSLSNPNTAYTESVEQQEGKSNSWNDDDFQKFDHIQESEPISSADQVTSEIDHIPTTSSRCEEAVVNEINQFRDLLSEIDCKIGKLTLARLLTAINSLPSPRANNMVNTEEILQLYDDLMRDTIRLEYLAFLLKQLTKPLRSLSKAEAVEKVVEFMNTYSISQEDFNTIVELSKFKLLVDDVNLIESGRVTLPAYNSTSEGSTGNASDEGAGKKGGQPWNSNSESNNGSKASRSDQERRKGIAWTKDEHMSVYCLLKYLENLGTVIYGCSKLHKVVYLS